MRIGHLPDNHDANHHDENSVTACKQSGPAEFALLLRRLSLTWMRWLGTPAVTTMMTPPISSLLSPKSRLLPPPPPPPPPPPSHRSTPLLALPPAFPVLPARFLPRKIGTSTLFFLHFPIFPSLSLLPTISALCLSRDMRNCQFSWATSHSIFPTPYLTYAPLISTLPYSVPSPALNLQCHRSYLRAAPPPPQHPSPVLFLQICAPPCFHTCGCRWQ